MFIVHNFNKMKPVNIIEKFSLINDYWNPRIIAELNGQSVKLAKVKGEFVWHDHKDEDELFYVVKGRLRIEFRDHIEEVNEGEMLVVKRGEEHRPIAEDEVWIMLFEPMETKHTGDVRTDYTVDDFERI